jgi:hypothetical protein
MGGHEIAVGMDGRFNPRSLGWRYYADILGTRLTPMYSYHNEEGTAKRWRCTRRTFSHTQATGSETVNSCRTIRMVARNCNLGLLVAIFAQSQEPNYNINLKLQDRRPASQSGCNPGDAVATGGNTRSAFQLCGYSGDVLPMQVYTMATSSVSKLGCYNKEDVRSQARKAYTSEWASSVSHQSASHVNDDSYLPS